MLHLAAIHNWIGEGFALAQRLFPMPVGADHLSAMAVREARTVALDNLQDDPSVPLTSRQLAVATGYNSIVIVPMVRDGKSRGAVLVARRSWFADDQVNLLQTFADQAVIAIENVRLFNETREGRSSGRRPRPTCSGDQPHDLRPQGRARRADQHGRSAVRRVPRRDLPRRGRPVYLASGLFGATPALIEHLSAHRSGSACATASPPRPPPPGTGAGGRRRHRRAHGRPDVQRVGGYRTLLAVPILREAEAIGVLTLGRAGPAPSTPRRSSSSPRSPTRRRSRWRTCACSADAGGAAAAEGLGRGAAGHQQFGGRPQPVFDKILDSCKHLFGGDELDVLLVDERGLLQIAAYIRRRATSSRRPSAPVERTPAGIAIRERRVAHWPDVLGDAPDVPNVLRRMGRGSATVRSPSRR